MEPPVLWAESGGRHGRRYGSGGRSGPGRGLFLPWLRGGAVGCAARRESWARFARLSPRGSWPPPVAPAMVGRRAAPSGERDVPAPGAWACRGPPRGRPSGRGGPARADRPGRARCLRAGRFFCQPRPGARRGRGVLAGPRPDRGSPAVGTPRGALRALWLPRSRGAAGASTPGGGLRVVLGPCPGPRVVTAVPGWAPVGRGQGSGAGRSLSLRKRPIRRRVVGAGRGVWLAPAVGRPVWCRVEVEFFREHGKVARAE